MSDATPKTGAPAKPQTLVITTSKNGKVVQHKLVAAVPGAGRKSKWIVPAKVSVPVRKAAAPEPSAPTPAPAAMALPPNLEDIAVRLARPMIREWLAESLPRLLGMAMRGEDR